MKFFLLWIPWYILLTFFAGLPIVTVLDSVRTSPISGHLKLQIAMIASSQHDKIFIVRPPCKQQTNGVDCGLFAIANATEFCFSSQIQNVDFDLCKLRSHWLECVGEGIIKPFPRASKRPKKTKEEDDTLTLDVYCLCRLPENFDNMVECDECGKWYHYGCVGYKKTRGLWNCMKCAQ
jgi:hypothetical protein